MDESRCFCAEKGVHLAAIIERSRYFYIYTASKTKKFSAQTHGARTGSEWMIWILKSFKTINATNFLCKQFIHIFPIKLERWFWNNHSLVLRNFAYTCCSYPLFTFVIRMHGLPLTAALIFLCERRRESNESFSIKMWINCSRTGSDQSNDWNCTRSASEITLKVLEAHRAGKVCTSAAKHAHKYTFSRHHRHRKVRD